MDIRELCTVLIMGCDEYSDVAYICSHFLEKNLDSSMKVVFCTEEKNISLKRVDCTVFSGKGVFWTDRLKKALSEISTPYILLLVDDSFLINKLEDSSIYTHIEVMRENNVGELKLIPAEYTRQLMDKGEYYQYSLNSTYRISYIPSLWKREYLENYAGDSLPVFIAERLHGEKSRRFEENIWVVKKSDVCFLNGVMSGKWTRNAYKCISREEDLKNLLSNRKKIGFWIYVKNTLFYILMKYCPKLIEVYNKKGFGRKK